MSSQWRLYTFVCAVSGGSICLRVPSLDARYVCVSSHWRLKTFVCPFSVGSIGLFVQSVVYPVSGGSILCV